MNEQMINADTNCSIFAYADCTINLLSLPHLLFTSEDLHTTFRQLLT